MSSIFTNFYNLTNDQKEQIKPMKKNLGMTLDEISRKFKITVSDVRRIISSKNLSKNWTEKQRKVQVEAGQKRAVTIRKMKDAESKNTRLH